MKDNLTLDVVLETFGFTLTAIQTEQTFKIISLILTCLATALTLAYRIYKWYKLAKKDGKITSEEIEEGIEIVKDTLEEISNKKGEEN